MRCRCEQQAGGWGGWGGCSRSTSSSYSAVVTDRNPQVDGMSAASMLSRLPPFRPKPDKSNKQRLRRAREEVKKIIKTQRGRGERWDPLAANGSREERKNGALILSRVCSKAETGTMKWAACTSAREEGAFCEAANESISVSRSLDQHRRRASVLLCLGQQPLEMKGV